MKPLRIVLVLGALLCTLWSVTASAQVKAVNPLDCDFNKDGIADVLWQNMGFPKNPANPSNGVLAVWYMNGTATPPTGEILPTVNPSTGWQVFACGDLQGNGNSDIIWVQLNRGLLNSLGFWIMNGTTITQECIFTADGSWYPIALFDLNGDGKLDVIWELVNYYADPGAPSNYAVWYMDGCTILSTGWLPNTSGGFRLTATGDFNGDGKADLLWMNKSGQLAIWLMDNTTILDAAILYPPGGTWVLEAVADFDGDGKSDLLWVDASNGQVAMWFMDGTSVASTSLLALGVPAGWFVAGTDDYNGDGHTDICWIADPFMRTAAKPWGDTAVWFMNGSTFLGSVSMYGPNYSLLNGNTQWNLIAGGGVSGIW